MEKDREEFIASFKDLVYKPEEIAMNTIRREQEERERDNKNISREDNGII